MLMKHTFLTLIILGSLLLIGGLIQRTVPSFTPTTGVVASPYVTVSYEGREGETVLDLVREKHTIETKRYDIGTLVTAIDGQSSNATQVWIYYVNGVAGNVATDQFVTRRDDRVEWRLEAVR